LKIARTISSSSNPVNTTVNTPSFPLFRRRPTIIALLLLLAMMMMMLSRAFLLAAAYHQSERAGGFYDALFEKDFPSFLWLFFF
jgi:hypothetical protein